MISIIIIVKNDRRIERLLNKLRHANRRNDTEIIVIDASNGKLDDIKKRNKYAKWYMFVNKSDKKITIPEQRNMGVKYANGNIIVFIDSDCIPNNKWLKELIYPLTDEGENIVAGKVTFSDNTSAHSLEFDKRNNQKYITEAPTMNLAIKKNLFNKIGLFDENFECGEDVDLLWRATKRGYKIRYNSKAIVFHDLGNLSRELIRMYTYGQARVKLYKKHSYRIKFFIGSDLLKIFYPLFFLFLPLSIYFPYYIFLFLILILKNRNRNILKLIAVKTSFGLGVVNGLIKNI